MKVKFIYFFNDDVIYKNYIIKNFILYYKIFYIIKKMMRIARENDRKSIRSMRPILVWCGFGLGYMLIIQISFKSLKFRRDVCERGPRVYSNA